MSACACSHQDQPVHSAFQRFFRVADSGDVVEDLAAPAVHGIYNAVRGAETGDDDGHLVLGTYFEVAFHTVIGVMNDEVDRIGSDHAFGLTGPQFRQGSLDS